VKTRFVAESEILKSGQWRFFLDEGAIGESSFRDERGIVGEKLIRADFREK
jgi:hypothetical protein